MVAIILAAGEGRKMFPFDLTRQKCAIPIANEPVVRRLVRQLQTAGVTRCLVVTGHHAGQVYHAVGDLKGVAFIHQPQRDGTGTATLLALREMPDVDEFVVAYGDIVLTQNDVTALLRAHADSAAVATVLVQRLAPPLESRDWLCAQVHGNHILQVQGHPRGASHRLAGMFAFRKDAIPFLERNPGVMWSVPVGGMPPLESELAQSLQALVDAGKEVLAVEAHGFVVDVDKPWHILEAAHHVVNELRERFPEDHIAPTARIEDSAEIDGRIVVGDGCIIGKRVVVNGFLLAEANTHIVNGAILRGRIVTGRHCRLRDYCLLGDCVLGHRCIVGHGAEFEGVAFSTVYLYHYCEIFGVLGEAVDIGAATVCGTLRFDDGETVHTVRGRREIPPLGANASYLGDFTRTGVNAILMPGVKVGAYCCIGPGVVLYDDVPHRTLVLVRQELTHRMWGPERYGW
ncbi:Bifunctional protein GlmU [bacterium HR17]|uniref:Bifunctional protein GlmU n=1 Tax=Candidatus Fervidibacter japonicus TaxID=2035412 RepID=A0A2H5XEA5_9BACT|nr:Bifunctional protein GlmU [bacterium HR17]